VYLAGKKGSAFLMLWLPLGPPTELEVELESVLPLLASLPL
jgi:hypothetical protein